MEQHSPLVFLQLSTCCTDSKPLQSPAEDHTGSCGLGGRPASPWGCGAQSQRCPSRWPALPDTCPRRKKGALNPQHRHKGLFSSLFKGCNTKISQNQVFLQLCTIMYLLFVHRQSPVAAGPRGHPPGVASSPSSHWCLLCPDYPPVPASKGAQCFCTHPHVPAAELVKIPPHATNTSAKHGSAPPRSPAGADGLIPLLSPRTAACESFTERPPWPGTSPCSPSGENYKSRHKAKEKDPKTSVSKSSHATFMQTQVCVCWDRTVTLPALPVGGGQQEGPGSGSGSAGGVRGFGWGSGHQGRSGGAGTWRSHRAVTSLADREHEKGVRSAIPTASEAGSRGLGRRAAHNEPHRGGALSHPFPLSFLSAQPHPQHLA